jgi:DNA-binding MarR family transcriptional regulator
LEDEPDPVGGDDLVAVERAMVRIRRSQTRRNLARMAAGSEGGELDLTLLGVLDAVEEGPPVAGAVVSVGAVAERLGVDPSRASRAVARAVGSGHVVRVPAEGDARVVGLALTDSGKATVARAHAARQEWFARVLDDWNPDDRHALAVLLTRFTDRLGAHVESS